MFRLKQSSTNSFRGDGTLGSVLILPIVTMSTPTSTSPIDSEIDAEKKQAVYMDILVCFSVSFDNAIASDSDDQARPGVFSI